MTEDGDRQNYIDIIGPVLPEIANDIISDVIIAATTTSSDTSHPHQCEQEMNISSVRVNNTHVFNVRTCEDWCGTVNQSSSKLIKSISFKRGLYYM